MKPDWIVHMILCERPTFHTHGLGRYGSMELELNLPLDPKQGSRFVNLIAAQIAEEGKRYQSGERVDEIFNPPFYLLQTKAIHASRPNDQVLRILFCDPSRKYPWEEGCQPPYSEQLSKEECATIRALLAGQAGCTS